jgi:NAD(P)-dependent dehydrogenase (short-subunit alcohol dehydrogenase family)
VETKVCAIIGVGPGNGMALARRWANAGYAVALLSRSVDKLETYAEELGENARAFACDAADPESVTGALAAVEGEFGPIDTLIYNAGAGNWGNWEAVDLEGFEHCWRVNTLGLYAAAKALAPAMIERGTGRIAVIGAGAAWRGRAGSIAFAAAKSSQRSVAQSLARDLGPRGIHVSYCVIDGVIDLPRTRQWMPDKPDEFFIQADHIAAAVFGVCSQMPSAWTFEFDVRPFGEDW